MNAGDNELEAVWSASGAFEELRRTGLRFEDRIRRRDRLETVVAILAAAYLVPVAALSLKVGSALITASFVLLILYCLAVPILLRTARPRPLRVDLPLVEYRREATLNYDRQIKILKHAWLWYAGPVWLASLMLFSGISLLIVPKLPRFAGNQWVLVLLALAPVKVSLVCYFIARANRRAAEDLVEERNRITSGH